MIHVIGIGPGQPNWLPPATHAAVERCDVLIGSSRALQLFPDFRKRQYHLSGDLMQTLQLIGNLLNDDLEIGVLVSGDPGFFSFLPALRREFPDTGILVYPGVSSLQLAFARAGIAWQEANFASVHGRELSSLPRNVTRPLAILTGGENTPQKVAQLFLERGVNPIISVGNALGYQDEFWDTMEADQLARFPQTLPNSILIVHPLPRQNPWQSNTLRIGIPDREFIRGDVPMTKAEIRVQVLAKAQISVSDHVLDIGAGTGSISIEAAALAGEGIVYAIESEPEAQQLIRDNIRKFGVPNMRLVPGSAPDVFSKIPPVDVCIVGGSRGHLAEILERVPLVEGGRLVMTAVTLESVGKGLEMLKSLAYRDIEVVSIQAVRWQEINHLHMAQSLNQVFIIAAHRGGKQ